MIQRALERAARGAAGVVELADHGITALVERIAPSPQLFVLGSGHDAAPIVTLAQSIGMRVTVADRAIREGSRFLSADRVIATAGAWDQLGALIDAAAEPYVVIMHHHRDADRGALAVALASRARYIGVLGPARRTHALLADLGRRPGEDPRSMRPSASTSAPRHPSRSRSRSRVSSRPCSGAAREGCCATGRALHADLAIAVLAAGGSRRLGRPKQLVEIDGAPLVRRRRDVRDRRSRPCLRHPPARTPRRWRQRSAICPSR